MKVFVSWSGATSNRVAAALRNWLTDMFHDVEPWMSEQDISPGLRWHDSLKLQLESSRVGILCLTEDNLNSPWLLFEAGCLSRDLAGAKVIPYLFDLTPTDVAPPLSQFQAVLADQAGTARLAAGVNSTLPRPLPEDKLRRAFLHWWPDLRRSLKSIRGERGTIVQVIRTEYAMLEELVELTREIRGSTAQSHSVQYAEAVRSVFRIIETIRRMDRPTFAKTIEKAEAEVSRDDPGATRAKLFLEVATQWLALGVPVSPGGLTAPDQAETPFSKPRSLKKRNPR